MPEYCAARRDAAYLESMPSKRLNEHGAYSKKGRKGPEVVEFGKDKLIIL
ncbi:MAG: hypothetical protein QXD77_03060 [Candidatus Aenigmatarchaeota archaeon]